MVSDKVHILLCGYYFHGNTGDDLLMESITATLSKYGDVKVINGFDPEKIDWCDLLVIGGGSHIRATSIGPHELAQYARKAGKKIIYYAQTIEEGHPLFKEHLALADLITVRDSASKRVVERYGFRAILSSDPIFKRKRHTIGFSFRRWVSEPIGIEEKLASILDNLSRDFDVVSIPYTPNDTDTESDTAFHEHIIQRMHHKPELYTYVEAIEKIDLLIGMRLHALISAINAGNKTLAIDYDAKIGRIFSDLSMGDLVVSYGDVEKIPDLVRNKIFRADALAQREKVNEALIAKLCADIKGEPIPQISAVMCSHNQADCIKKAIESVIDQTIKDWELIIIDDGSVDNTGEIVSHYSDVRIKHFNFGHNGLGFSRNIGNLLSRGKIICVADPDSISTPERFASITKEMEQTKADVIYSSLFFSKPDGEKELIVSQRIQLYISSDDRI
jgi:polysaccharide pyruvyl transferase WcaK-like protein